jgi:hypothetical protein
LQTFLFAFLYAQKAYLCTQKIIMQNKNFQFVFTLKMQKCSFVKIRANFAHRAARAAHAPKLARNFREICAIFIRLIELYTQSNFNIQKLPKH